MGVGAAASEPGTLSVIRHLYPDPEERARALGAWAAVSGLALALGPVIGGVLVGIGTWRAVFYFNVVAAAVVLSVAARVVPESADPQSARLDLPGFATGAGGLGALTFAVILGETEGYRSPAVVVLFVLGVVGLVGFTRVERTSRAPILDLAYFRSPPFSGSLAVAFVLFFGVFSIFFFTALYLSAVVGYSPYRVALEFLPMTVALIAAAGLAGRRVALQGPRLSMAGGCVLAGTGILLSQVLLGVPTPSLWLMATLALAGFGFGTSVVPVTSPFPARLGRPPSPRGIRIARPPKQRSSPTGMRSSRGRHRPPARSRLSKMGTASLRSSTASPGLPWRRASRPRSPRSHWIHRQRRRCATR